MRSILATGIVLSSLLLPAAANASTPSDDASATAQAPRVSTGVTAPTLLESAIDIHIPADLPQEAIPVDAQVGLTFVVDEKGNPQNIHVIKSFNSFWDARIVEAVSKFHYRPGTVDAQPIPIDMNLTVNIAR
jgi:Gram-negative bacterial TonB protein C-terminal